MARPERVEYEGAYYHVMNRGHGRQSVFHEEKYLFDGKSRLRYRMVDDDELKGVYEVLCQDLTS